MDLARLRDLIAETFVVDMRTPGTEENPASVAVRPWTRVGLPCVAGTRIDTESIASIVWEGQDPTAEGWYPRSLRRDDVLVACWYEATYGAKRWRRRWGAWARQFQALRTDAYPPSKGAS